MERSYERTSREDSMKNGDYKMRNRTAYINGRTQRFTI